MKVAGNYVGLGLGDTSPEIPKIKALMKKKYTPARNTLDDSQLFDAAMDAEVRREQPIFEAAGRLKPGWIPGVINLEFKYAIGLLDRPRPIFFSVEGHMSDPEIGPVAWLGQCLENEGRAWHQWIAYNRTKMPFDNKSGVDELARLLGLTNVNGRPFPPGTPWMCGGFSQGALVTTEFYRDWLAPGKPLNWRLKDLCGYVTAGNAYRQTGYVAPWIPDPPKPDRKGISNVNLINTPWWWVEIARKGDLYTDIESSGKSGLNKSAIYRVVAQSSFTGGPTSVLARVIDILSLSDDLIPLAVSIISAMSFLFNMSPHGVYDMDPCLQWCRERLAAGPIGPNPPVPGFAETTK